MDDHFNAQLLKNYCQEHGYINRELYSAVLLSLQLRENGISSTVANAIAYGRFLLGSAHHVEGALQSQLTLIAGKVWRSRAQALSNGKEQLKSHPLVIGKCPHCQGQVYSYVKNIACQNNLKENGSTCPFYLFRDLGAGPYYLSDEEFKELLINRKYGPLQLKRKDGSSFTSHIQLQFISKENRYKLTFVRED